MATAVPRINDYHVGLITAIVTEYTIACAVLDGTYGPPVGVPVADSNTYTFGHIGDHKVVVVCLPQGRYGLVSATTVAENLRRSFSSLRFGLMVGVGGGAPSEEHDIRLGHAGVIQYNYGKDVQNKKFQRTGSLNEPPRCLLTASTQLRGQHMLYGHRISQEVELIIQKYDQLRDKYQRPEAHTDILYKSSYEHPPNAKTCDEVCVRQHDQQVDRAKRSSLKNATMVHYGLIASADSVLKNALVRDDLAEAEGVLCFEMEAAGLVNSFPCIIIRGICDYSDSHKNKKWQGYAAAAAAVYAKELLLTVRAEPSAAAEDILVRKHDDAHSDSEESDMLGGRSSLSRDRRACLQSLRFEGIDTRLRDIRQASDGTCLWIESHPIYQRWIQQNHGLLWIKGKPGAGKSVLLKSILQRVENRQNIDKSVIVSFFVHGRGSPLQRSATGLYRSLLHQILSEIRPLLADFTTRVFIKNKEERGELGVSWDWNESQLLEYLHTKVRNYAKERRIKIFIDALDECGEETARQIAQDLARLARASPDSRIAFSICFTCRHFPIMNLYGGLEVSVDKQNSMDISMYAQNELMDEFPDAKQRSLLVEDIFSRSSGLFLWVVLIVRKVLTLSQNGHNLRAIRKIIQETASELWPMYDEAFSEVPSHDKIQSLRVIQWICLAELPLSLSSLRYALSFDAENPHDSLADWTGSDNFLHTDEQMRKRINALSGGLLEVVELADLVVQFIHQSVKDYFMTEGMLKLAQSVTDLIHLETLNITIGSAHRLMSRCCVRYMLTDEIRSLPETPWTILRYQYPFLEYAVSQWHVHAVYAESCGTSVGILLDDLEWPSIKALRHWITLYSELPVSSTHGQLIDLGATSSTMHIAARYGLSTLVGAAIAKPGLKHINHRDSLGTTALTLAIRKGHTATVRAFLELGARHDIVDREERSPLYWAASYGRTSIAEMLLDKSADPNARSYPGDTPLICAAKLGNKALVDVLLARGADPDRADKQFRSPLWWAAYHWHGEIVEVLLRHGGNPTNININGLSLLEMTVCLENWHKIELLVNKGSRSDSEPLDEETFSLILSQAIKASRPDVVNMILQKGANPNAQNKYGETPLEEAIYYRTPDVAEILIANGALLGFEHESLVHITARPGPTSLMSLLLKKFNPDVTDSDGITPLCNAIIAGNKDMINLLIHKGATVNAIGMNQRGPLSLAASLDDRETVDLILRREVDVNCTDRRSRTPLHYAAMNNYSIIVEKLLAANASLDIRDISGSTPLIWAVKQDAINIVRLLLQAGARTDIENHKLQTPLMWSTRLPSTKMILLLSSTPGLEKRDDQGRTALFWAIEAGNVDIIDVLLQTGADVSSPNAEGLTPLLWAAGHSSLEVVSKLLEKDIEIEKRDSRGFSALWHAVLNRKDDVALLLLRKGANLNAKNLVSHTLLQHACLTGSMGAVGFLISNRVDINASRTENWNLLIWAAEVGNRQMIEMIFFNRRDLKWSDTDKIKAFFQAVVYSRTEVVEFFVRGHIVQVDCQESQGQRRYTALWLAVTKNLVAMVELLTRLGADIHQLDSQRRTPLSYACEFDQEEIVKLLLSSSEHDFNTPDVQGRTPFWWAVAYGSAVAVKLFLEKGKMDPRFVSESLGSPLTTAVQRGNVAMTKILLEFNAELSQHRILASEPPVLSESGRNAAVRPKRDTIEEKSSLLLPLATENGDEAMVKLLLQYNAKYEGLLPSNETVLTWAVKRGNFSIVKTLLEGGASVDQTALEWAIYGGDQNIRRLLIEHELNK